MSGERGPPRGGRQRRRGRLVPPLPVSLYVHVPWCLRKCPYCDFNSHRPRGRIPERRFLETLFADLDWEVGRFHGRSVGSVFFGGGTPSLLSPDTIQALIDAIGSRFTVVSDLEVTLEANPGTVDRPYLEALRAAGVNRISVGVQSFSSRLLAAIGRVHSGEEALAAVEQAQAAGFENINVDLMFALPGQSVADCAHDVRTAIALQPAHVSYYELTIEPNTAFQRRPPSLPDEGVIWAMWQRSDELLQGQGGYGRYEVSAYARPEARCRHNVNYWRFGDYLGVGPGAHGKRTALAPAPGIERTRKLDRPQGYLTAMAGADRLAERAFLGPAQIVLEFMMNALRLREGFAPALFERRTGMALESIARPLQRASAMRLLRVGPDRIKPTECGYRFLNELTALFALDDSALAGWPGQGSFSAAAETRERCNGTARSQDAVAGASDGAKARSPSEGACNEPDG